MAVPIPSPLVDFILLGPLDDRRQLQDSPILGDVWIEYAKQPARPLDLLIVPYRSEHPGALAGLIEDELLGENKNEIAPTPSAVPTWQELTELHQREQDARGPRSVAYLQGLVVAQLTFSEMMKIVAPKTPWWISKSKSPATATQPESINPDLKGKIHEVLRQAIAWHSKEFLKDAKILPSFDRFLTLMSLILWAGEQEFPREIGSRSEEQTGYILDSVTAEDLERRLAELTAEMFKAHVPEPMVWQISLNRRAMPALSRSIPAVKADAAKTLFKVDCSDIGWAVIDSGIDGGHPGFATKDGGSRVKRSFDFKNFRRVVSV